MDIRERLKTVLKLRGKTMAQMYNTLDIRKSAAANWFGGKRRIELAVLYKVANYCGCSVDYLLGRTDSPDPWAATAMDELKLSSQAVGVIHGESPDQHQLLNKLKKEYPGHEKEIEHDIQRLDARQESIHDTVAALLSSEYFEHAMLKLECACRFNADAASNKDLKEKQNTYASYGDEISDLGNGRYAVPLGDVSKYRKSAALDDIRKALDDAVEIYTRKYAESVKSDLAEEE